jgi:hypothetical protein
LESHKSTKACLASIIQKSSKLATVPSPPLPV